MTDRTETALRDMAREEPELAARLAIQGLPAAAARLSRPLTYDLCIEGLGDWRVRAGNGDAAVIPLNGEASAEEGGAAEFRIRTDPRGLAELAAGRSPLRLVAARRLRLEGRRRRALRLRELSSGPAPTLADVAAAGGPIDLDAVQRALAYLIDPEWTRGHRFVVGYEIASENGDAGGTWYVRVNDGERIQVTAEPPAGERVAATARLSAGTFRRLAAREMTPGEAIRDQLTRVEGEMHPLVLTGRWIERSQGRDDEEMAREAAQRELQERRVGTWGSARNGSRPSAPGQGDPGHASEGERRAGRDLLSYGELYALWERQNWRAHEIDFSVDREHWLATPAEGQENTMWSLGSFYVGEERVTADLAPFLLAAPSGEVEMFLATQLVDEARHAAFFDRFGAEVMVLSAEDLRGRMRELDEMMLGQAWHHVFDDGLRDVAMRIRDRPDDIDLFVEGITTYHMVIEGVLAMTGQRFILSYLEGHGLYPGFQRGFSLVEQDEHRHIAFGVRFLKEMVETDSRHGRTILDRVVELVPKAMHVFVPPYADSAEEFVSYGYHSSQIYGYAYRALKRRLAVVGLEAPPVEDLMPGPIATPEEARAAGAPA